MMKIKEKKEVEIVSDILCDVCLESTRVEGYSLQYAILQAHWGYGSAHDGERYDDGATHEKAVVAAGR